MSSFQPVIDISNNYLAQETEAFHVTIRTQGNYLMNPGDKESYFDTLGDALGHARTLAEGLKNLGMHPILMLDNFCTHLFLDNNNTQE